MIDLPGILAQIAEVAGEAAALQVAASKGGTIAYFPQARHLDPDHWLVEAVGPKAAAKIAALFEDREQRSVEIPLGPLSGVRGRARRALARALSEGKSVSQAARLAGVHMRTARRHKNQGVEIEEAQIDLPFRS